MPEFHALVINPYITDFKLYDEWMHPLGLYFLIDVLASNKIIVHYYNCVNPSPDDPLKKYGTNKIQSVELQKPACYRTIKRKYKMYGCSRAQFHDFINRIPKVDVVFIGTMMTYWIDGVVETISRIRELLPTVPIVCGGIAAQLLPQIFRRQLPGVSIFSTPIFSGNRQITLPGVPFSLVIPDPSSLLNAFKVISPCNHGPVLLSLGCPLRCSYCASGILQPLYRKRSLQIIQKETEWLIINNGVKDIAFYDDALLLDAQEVFVPFLQWIIHWQFSVRFHTPNGLHLKYVTKRLLELMSEAGFTTVRFGYESGQAKHQSQTGGKADRSLLCQKLKIMEKIGFPHAGVYIMGGLPECTPEEVIDEMRFVASFGVAVKPVFLSPVPGTALFKFYAKKFPILKNDPHWHNDTFFISQLPHWGEEGVESVRQIAKELNDRSIE